MFSSLAIILELLVQGNLISLDVMSPCSQIHCKFYQRSEVSKYWFKGDGVPVRECFIKDLPFCLRGSSSVYCFATSDTEFELRKKWEWLLWWKCLYLGNFRKTSLIRIATDLESLEGEHLPQQSLEILALDPNFKTHSNHTAVMWERYASWFSYSSAENIVVLEQHNKPSSNGLDKFPSKSLKKKRRKNRLKVSNNPS